MEVIPQDTLLRAKVWVEGEKPEDGTEHLVIGWAEPEGHRGALYPLLLELSVVNARPFLPDKDLRWKFHVPKVMVW